MPHSGEQTSLAALKRRLQKMDDEDFEYFIADLWGRQGWECEVSQKSRDKSLDVMAEKTEPYHQRHAIQAKRYQSGNRVGGPTVSEISSLTDYFDADLALIVTTSDFTSDARERADQLGVRLINGDDLAELIKKNDAEGLVDKYSEASSPSAAAAVSPNIQVDLGDVSPDVAEAIKNQELEATRALERARGAVKLNPHDANRLGIWDDLPQEVKQRRFQESKRERVKYVDDLHFDAEGEVFVEDLREYISASAIKGSPSGPVVGIIRRGVRDGAWASDGGEMQLAAKERIKNLKQSLRSFAAKWDSWYLLSVAGVVAGVIGLGAAVIASVVPQPIAGLLALVALVSISASPFAAIGGVILDTMYVSSQQVSWSPSAKMYALGCLVLFPIAFPVYLYQRQKHIGL